MPSCLNTEGRGPVLPQLNGPSFVDSPRGVDGGVDGGGLDGRQGGTEGEDICSVGHQTNYKHTFILKLSSL